MGEEIHGSSPPLAGSEGRRAGIGRQRLDERGLLYPAGGGLDLDRRKTPELQEAGGGPWIGSATGAAVAPVKEPPAAGSGYGSAHGHGGGAHNFKTKMCEKFAKGIYTFGERCHFTHGPNDLLRKGAAA
ncbi:Zinc finger CCCH domain-containing protein 14 [Platanthera guangdongensis]|uniref:Zinc finger CCCH domain-containing protein 14 n=1 Tax=Platanthera guangdongensis TaxID=2320717 RepID=A0ABR2LXA4_9ASPA